jgi:hypothetical protein
MTPASIREDLLRRVRAGLRPTKGTATLVTALAAALVVLWSGLTESLPSSRARGEAHGADAPSYVRIARGLLRGSVTLPPPGRIDEDSQQRLWDPFGTPYALGPEGRLLPKHSILFALLLAPGVALADHDGAMVSAILLGSAVAAFAAAAAARVFGMLPAFAAVAGLLVLTPAGRWIATGVNLDTALAAGMLAAFGLAARGHAFSAGFLAGFGALLRPTAPILLLPAVAALPGPGRRRAFVRFTAGFATGGGVTAAVHTLLWGAPWRTGYDRAVVFTADGQRLASHSAEFGANPLDGLVALLLAPSAGLLVLGPAAFLALAGYAIPAARRPEWVLASAAATASFLFLAPYAFVQAIPAGNYRFGFPLLVSAIPPLACLVAEAARLLFLRRAPDPPGSGGGASEAPPDAGAPADPPAGRAD